MHKGSVNLEEYSLTWKLDRHQTEPTTFRTRINVEEQGETLGFTFPTGEKEVLNLVSLSISVFLYG